MKALLFALTCFVLSSQVRAAFWEVTVSGTASYQQEFGTHFSIRTEKVNNARIFQQYNVTPENYALTSDTVTGVLYLLPRHEPITAENQIPVLHNFESSPFTIIRSRPVLSGMRELPVANTNVVQSIFDNFRGTAIFRIREAGKVGDRTIVKGSGTVVGSGGGRIFNLRITLGKEFTPVPEM